MIDLIVTDFGPVRLEKVSEYLRGLDPNWREVVANKRKRGKHARSLRSEVARMEAMVTALAHVEYATGGTLERV